MRYLTVPLAFLLTLASLGHSPAQTLAGYQATQPENTTSTSQTVSYQTTQLLLVPITSNTVPFDAFFTGTLGDLSFQSATTADLTQTISFENSIGTIIPVASLTLDSGALTASTVITPADFAKSTSALGPAGTYNRVVFNVTGPLAPGGTLTFSGGINAVAVPEPKSILLLLAVMGTFALLKYRSRCLA